MVNPHQLIVFLPTFLTVLLQAAGYPAHCMSQSQGFNQSQSVIATRKINLRGAGGVPFHPRTVAICAVSYISPPWLFVLHVLAYAYVCVFEHMLMHL